MSTQAHESKPRRHHTGRMPQLEIPPPPGLYVNSYYCPICHTPLDDGYCHSCDVVPSTARFAPYWKAAAVTDQAFAKQHTALVTILEGLNAERAEYVNARSTQLTEDTRERQTSPTPADENPFAVPNADTIPGIPAAPDSEASPQAAAYEAAMADEETHKARRGEDFSPAIQSDASGSSIAKILVGIGGFLLGIAVLTFLAVSMAVLDLEGRIAVGGLFGCALVGAGLFADTRGLRSTGQALAAVATAVFYIDATAYATMYSDGGLLSYIVIMSALMAGGLTLCNIVHKSINYRLGAIFAALLSLSTIAPWVHNELPPSVHTSAALGAATMLLPLILGSWRFFRTQWLSNATGVITMLGSIAASLLGLIPLALWNHNYNVWIPVLLVAVGYWGYARLHPRPSKRATRSEEFVVAGAHEGTHRRPGAGYYSMTTAGRLFWQGLAVTVASLALADGLDTTFDVTLGIAVPYHRVALATFCVVALVMAGATRLYTSRDAGAGSRSALGTDDDGILTMFKVSLAFVLVPAAGFVAIAVTTLTLLIGTPFRADSTFSDTLREAHPVFLRQLSPVESSLWMLALAITLAAVSRVTTTHLLRVPAWALAALSAGHAVSSVVPTRVASSAWDMLILSLALLTVGALGIFLTHRFFPARNTKQPEESARPGFSETITRHNDASTTSRYNRIVGLGVFSAITVVGVHCGWMAGWAGAGLVVLAAASLFLVATRIHHQATPAAYLLAAATATAVVVAPWAGLEGNVFHKLTTLGFVGSAALVAIGSAVMARRAQQPHAALSAAGTVAAAVFLTIFGAHQIITFIDAGRTATPSGDLTLHAVTLATLTVGFAALRFTPVNEHWNRLPVSVPAPELTRYVNTAAVTAMGATGAGVLMVPGLIGGSASFASTIGYGTWQALCEVGVAAVAVFFLRRSRRAGDSSTSFVTMTIVHMGAASFLAYTTLSRSGELGWLTCVALVPVLAAAARVCRGQFIARPFAVLAVIAACVGWCWRMADGGTTTLEWYTWPVAGLFAIIAVALTWLAARKRTAADTTVDDAVDTGADTPESAAAELGDAATRGTATPTAAHALLTNSGTSRFLTLTAYGLAVLPTAAVGVGNSLWREWVALAASALVVVVLLGARRLGLERSTRGAWLGLAAASLMFGPIPNVMMLDGLHWAMYAAITAVTITLAYGAITNYVSTYPNIVNTYCVPAIVMILMLVVNMVTHPYDKQPFTTIVAVFTAALITLVVPLLAPTLVAQGRQRTMFATNATLVTGVYAVLWLFMDGTPILDTLWFIIIGVTMTAIGLAALYTDEESSSAALFAPGYVLAVLPHAFHQVFYHQTNPLLGLAVLLLLGTVALLIGLRAHFIAPTILGGTTLILTGLHVAHKLGSNVVPTSVVIGAVGVVLLVLGATAEKRLQEFRAVKAHLSTFR